MTKTMTFQAALAAVQPGDNVSNLSERGAYIEKQHFHPFFKKQFEKCPRNIICIEVQILHPLPKLCLQCENFEVGGVGLVGGEQSAEAVIYLAVS